MFFNDKLLYRADISTDTEMHLIAYIGAVSEFDTGNSIIMRLEQSSQNEEGELVFGDDATEVVFVPEELMPTATLTDTDGNLASISAVGIST